MARGGQARAAAAGYDPGRFAEHSLRAGFITAGARAGASVFKLKEVSRHRSTDVLAAYVRDAHTSEDHAGDGFLWRRAPLRAGDHAKSQSVLFGMAAVAALARRAST